MAQVAADGAGLAGKPTSMRMVVAASSAGTAFEWYDFFVFGTLAAVISKNFFSTLDETAGLLAALGLFGAGFFFRPIGALIFGRKAIAGSLIGGIAETQEMLDFCAKHGIVSDIEMIRMQEIDAAYDRMLKSDVKYRFVIDMASLK